MTQEWARWPSDAADEPWRLGVEEEIMLIDAEGMLSPGVDELLPSLPEELARQASAETNAAALEIQTEPMHTVGAAVERLGELRSELADATAKQELRPAVSGTHPLATFEHAFVSGGERYGAIHDTMREIARREPTFALHVHVGIPDAETAVRSLDGVRAHLPLLLALSGNSPFWQARDSGLVSARTPIFGAFPRVGLPRRFGDYGSYVEVIDRMIRAGAIADPTYLWWDARLQPRYGTLEVRIMDAQSRVDDSAPLIALVQCLVHREAVTDPPPHAPDHLELLQENRFLAARDGVEACLVDTRTEMLCPVMEILEDLVERLMPHAEELGCVAELQDVWRLAARPGAQHQRAVAGSTGFRAKLDRGSLLAVVDDLALQFSSPKPTVV